MWQKQRKQLHSSIQRNEIAKDKLLAFQVHNNKRCTLLFGFVSDELCFHWVAHNISNKCTCIAQVIDIRTTKSEFQRFKLIRCQSSLRKCFDSIQRLFKTLATCHQTQFSTFSIEIWTDEHIIHLIKVLLTTKGMEDFLLRYFIFCNLSMLRRFFGEKQFPFCFCKKKKQCISWNTFF